MLSEASQKHHDDGWEQKRKALNFIFREWQYHKLNGILSYYFIRNASLETEISHVYLKAIQDQVPMAYKWYLFQFWLKTTPLLGAWLPLWSLLWLLVYAFWIFQRHSRWRCARTSWCEHPCRARVRHVHSLVEARLGLRRRSKGRSVP